MVDTRDNVVVRVSAENVAGAERELVRYRKTYEAATGGTAAASKRAEAAILRSNTAISGSFKALAGSIAAGASASAIIKYADGYTQLQNRLKTSGLEGANLIKVQDGLYESANRNGVAVNSLAEVYSRASLTAKTLGADQAQLQKFTDTVSNAVRVQGTTSEAASGALLQLSQSLGSGTVHAEEFNSILEGLPIIAQVAAQNIAKYQGNVAALRADVIKGNVSSQEFFQAILKGSDDLAARAGKSTLTIAGAFQTLNNEIGRYVGQTSASLSASQRLAEGIVELSKHLDVIAPALAAIAVLIGTRYVGATIASTAATVRDSLAKAAATVETNAYTAALSANVGILNAEAIATAKASAATVGLGGAMNVAGVAGARAGSLLLAAFGGPVGAAILAVTLAVAGLSYAYTKLVEPTKQVKTATDNLSASTDIYTKATQIAVGLSGQAQVSALKEAAAKKELAKQSLKVSESLLTEAQSRLALARAAYTSGPALNSVGPMGAQVGTTGSIKASLDIGREDNNIKALQASIEKAKAAIASGDAILNAGNGLGAGTGTGKTKKAKEDPIKAQVDDLLKSGLSETDAAYQKYLSDVKVLNEAFAKGYINDLERQIVKARLDANIDQVLNPISDVKPLEAVRPADKDIEDTTHGMDAITRSLTDQEVLYNNVADAAEYSFARAKGSVEDFAETFKNELLSMAAAWAASKLGELIFGKRDQYGDRSGGLLESLSGHRATGGPVRAGGAYLVGEKRPEVFVPNTSGKIVPSVGQYAKSSAMQRPGGGGTHIYAPLVQISADSGVVSEAWVQSQNQKLRQARDSAVEMMKRALPGEINKINSFGTN